MQIEKFRYLIQLAEAGSFYAAAKETYLSQQGLSKAISTLETELGTELIVRGPRGVTLTPAGKITLEYAKKIVADRDELIEQLIHLVTHDENGPRRIRIYATLFGMRCMDCIDRSFIFTHALISECTFAELMEHIGSLDDDELLVCGVHPTMREQIEKTGNVLCVTFAQSRWGIVVHESSPLAQRDQVRIEDLVDLPCSIPASQELTMLTDLVIDTHDLTDVRLRTNSPHLLGDFLASNPNGIALCDSLTFYLTQTVPSRAVPNSTFIPLATDMARVELIAIARRDTPHPMLSHQALEWMAGRIADQNQAYFKARASDSKR